MLFLCADYAHDQEALRAQETLVQYGFAEEEVALRPSSHPDLGRTTVQVDLSHAPVQVDVVEAVLHRHHPARVYGNPSEQPVAEEFPTAPG